MEDPKVNFQTTEFLVTISLLTGTNWYEVKSHMLQLLVTRIEEEIITSSYLIRETRQYWEDKNVISSLQDKRTATKVYSGNSFEIDNKGLFRILSNTFSVTTLEDVIINH